MGANKNYNVDHIKWTHHSNFGESIGTLGGQVDKQPRNVGQKDGSLSCCANLTVK